MQVKVLQIIIKKTKVSRARGKFSNRTLEMKKKKKLFGVFADAKLPIARVIGFTILLNGS